MSKHCRNQNQNISCNTTWAPQKLCSPVRPTTTRCIEATESYTYSHAGIGLGYVDNRRVELLLLIIGIADDGARKCDATQHDARRPHLRPEIQLCGCFVRTDNPFVRDDKNQHHSSSAALSHTHHTHVERAVSRGRLLERSPLTPLCGPRSSSCARDDDYTSLFLNTHCGHRQQQQIAREARTLHVSKDFSLSLSGRSTRSQHFLLFFRYSAPFSFFEVRAHRRR